MSITHRFYLFAKLIKWEHTVFALPFAILGFVLGCHFEGAWDFEVLVWVLLAMIGGRTFGMTLNRYIDRYIDSKNPRTQLRPSVTGEIKPNELMVVSIGSMMLMVLAVFQLNQLCQMLLPLALFLLVIYHYLKRFTFLCHLGIGLVLGITPIAGWIAVTGSWSWPICVLGLAVTCWVAGFDIIYSSQDADIDKELGLHSLPSVMGVKKSLWVASGLHFAAFLLFSWLGILYQFNYWYWVGVLFVGSILLVEHVLIRIDPKKHIHTAFFTLNGMVSIVYALVGILSIRS